MNTLVLCVVLAPAVCLVRCSPFHEYQQPEQQHQESYGSAESSYGHQLEPEEHHAPVHYSFHYDVHDPHTGDVKSQHETRTGDVVTGFYSLVEPDGTIRTVKYKADAHNGFNAVVDRKKPHFATDDHHQEQQHF
ncbi:cuticle protein 7-like [Adelges cooleyi]|uniref:cuticle protein 7-like n=1 Tax=Adelges cooleyi TaxID=133065 RepID=UPI00218051F6|nr:cuticle protein 7-like [Adelges cooleyi]